MRGRLQCWVGGTSAPVATSLTQPAAATCWYGGWYGVGSPEKGGGHADPQRGPTPRSPHPAAAAVRAESCRGAAPLSTVSGAELRGAGCGGTLRLGSPHSAQPCTEGGLSAPSARWEGALGLGCGSKGPSLGSRPQGQFNFQPGLMAPQCVTRKLRGLVRAEPLLSDLQLQPHPPGLARPLSEAWTGREQGQESAPERRGRRLCVPRLENSGEGGGCPAKDTLTQGHGWALAGTPRSVDKSIVCTPAHSPCKVVPRTPATTAPHSCPVGWAGAQSRALSRSQKPLPDRRQCHKSPRSLGRRCPPCAGQLSPARLWAELWEGGGYLRPGNSQQTPGGSVPDPCGPS